MGSIQAQPEQPADAGDGRFLVREKFAVEARRAVMRQGLVERQEIPRGIECGDGALDRPFAG